MAPSPTNMPARLIHGAVQSVGWYETRQLWRYVAWRALAPVLIGAALGLATIALGVGGLTLGTLIASTQRAETVVLGVVIGLAGSGGAAQLSRHHAWRVPVARALARFESLQGGERLVTVVIASRNGTAAVRALMPAQFYVPSGRLPWTLPDDQPDVEVTVYEPAFARRSTPEEFWAAVDAALSEAGIAHRQSSTGTLLDSSVWPA